MYLFFDDPDDQAISFLQDYERVECVRCDARYWAEYGGHRDRSVEERQEANATRAWQWAKEQGFDWLVHLDSDELLHSKRGLRSLFARQSSRTDVVLFPVMEAVPQAMRCPRPFHDISLFKYYAPVGGRHASFTMTRYDQIRYWMHVQAWRRRKQVATALGCAHSQIIGQYLLGHMVGKSATRTTAPVARIQNHLPVPQKGKQLTRSVAFSAAVLHFDCRGYDPWKAKWARRLRGEADFDFSRFAPHRRKQLTRLQAAYEDCNKAALESIYRKWYIIPDNERRIMRTLGLLRTVERSPHRFELAPTTA